MNMVKLMRLLFSALAASIVLLITSIFLPLSATAVSAASPTLRHSDVFFPVDLPFASLEAWPSSPAPPAPGYYETSEYLIGSVAVAIVFLESNGSIDSSTENWTPTEELQVMGEIQTALNWWSAQNPAASVTFKVAVNYSVPTAYEPINRRGGSATVNGEESLWIRDAMNFLGYTGSDYFAQTRDFINARRSFAGTDWAFAVFVVDSSNDIDGRFSDGVYSAYGYLGGPFLVLTYDNDGWGINRMDQVAAHETGHIFYATDEYNGFLEFSGYLNVPDNDGSNALMDTNINWWLSAGTSGQIGWRDTDSDGILDIIDTVPDSVLSPYLPDPTNMSNLLYTGSVREVPYPNNNPNNLYGRANVTLNAITRLQYRVNGGAWYNATSTDSAFDEPEESFSFTLSSLSSGMHSVEVRGVNSVGNVEASYGADSVMVDLTLPTTSISYSSPNFVKGSMIYVSAKTSFSLTAADTVSGTSASYYKVGDGLWTLYAGSFSLAGVSEGLQTIYFYSKDNAGNRESAGSLLVAVDSSGPSVTFASLTNGSIVNTSDVDIVWNSLDDVGVQHSEIRIDQAGYVNTAAPTNHTFLNTSEGTHNVYVRVFDWLGNSKEVMIQFLVDVSAPTLSLRPTSVKNASELRTTSADLSWTGQDAIAGIDHYEVKLDDNSWISVGTSSTYTFTQVAEGSHRAYIKAVDEAGNSAFLLVNFVINTSLLGGPGWLDDALVFGAVGVGIVVAIGFFLRSRKRRSRAKSPST